MDRRLILSLAVACVLWFVMFSPWVGIAVNFWLIMSLSALVLSSFALTGRRQWRDECSLNIRELLFGVAIAVALWVAFWIGDKLAALLFSFSAPQISAIYGLRDGHSSLYIGLALLLLIGPAEEIFWRGYVQHSLSKKLGSNTGYVLTTLVYTFVHIWSFNIMLLLSAFVAGAAWGLLYRLLPKSLTAIILSHALWDCAVFIIFPIGG